jgi:hypothetical protein
MRSLTGFGNMLEDDSRFNMLFAIVMLEMVSEVVGRYGT